MEKTIATCKIHSYLTIEVGETSDLPDFPYCVELIVGSDDTDQPPITRYFYHEERDEALARFANLVKACNPSCNAY